MQGALIAPGPRRVSNSISIRPDVGQSARIAVKDPDREVRQHAAVDDQMLLAVDLSQATESRASLTTGAN